MAERDDRGISGGNGLLAAAIVAAALILSWSSSGSEPRYQLAATDNGVVRMDTDSGALIACDLQRCRPIEAPARAKTFGPLTFSVDSDERKIGLSRKRVEWAEEAEGQPAAAGATAAPQELKGGVGKSGPLIGPAEDE